jgi:hypothetical protein
MRKGLEALLCVLMGWSGTGWRGEETGTAEAGGLGVIGGWLTRLTISYFVNYVNNYFQRY